MEKEKEPVKDASSFDCPNFDLGLTPTPPDVNIDAKTQNVSVQGMSIVIQS